MVLRSFFSALWSTVLSNTLVLLTDTEAINEFSFGYDSVINMCLVCFYFLDVAVLICIWADKAVFPS
mgnify:CR=1 FL=1